MADAVVGAFDSNDVMAYILLKASEDNFFVNITKLQKLLYCCYGVVLAAFGWRLTANVQRNQERKNPGWKGQRIFSELPTGSIKTD